MRRILPAFPSQQRCEAGLRARAHALAMLTDAFADETVGMDLRYRTDGKLFNLKRLQAKTKTKRDTARDMLFADDFALCVSSLSTQEEMQESTDLFSSACNNFGLTISVKKTEVLFQPAPGNEYLEGNVFVEGQRLTPCEKFVYLGSTLSKSATIDDEITLRTSRACAALGGFDPPSGSAEALL